MSTTETLTLAEFLLARIAVDEGVARAALDQRHPARWHRDGMGIYAAHDLDPIVEWVNHHAGPHIARWDPARVLAECEAKRRMVKRHSHCGTGWGYCDDGGHGWGDPDPLGCAELADLALPYADRPGYREEWRP